MWDFDSLYGKAQAYFERGAEHSHSDDEEFVLWHLLGLEFLLRAPLGRIHPSLLAATEGEALLHANGIPVSSEPESIPSHTVISRLGRVVPGFTKERQEDSQILLNLRNAELHTGDATVANLRNEFWLPKLIRVATTIAEYLGVALDDVLGGDVVALGRSLIDDEDKKLANEVRTRITHAKAFIEQLTPEELTRRRSTATVVGPRGEGERVDCPACCTNVPISLEQVRTSGERFDGDYFVRDIVYVAASFDCPVCSLSLGSTAEVMAAGLPQQVTREVAESLEDRFMSGYVDDEYMNE